MARRRISFLYLKGEFAQTPTPDLNLLDMQLPRKEGHTLQFPSNLNDRGAPQR
jgi:hypothetical protein